MSFVEWKKRSEAFKNVMEYSEPTDSNIHRACQAAYKAGERQGMKDAKEMSKREIEFYKSFNDSSHIRFEPIAYEISEEHPLGSCIYRGHLK